MTKEFITLKLDELIPYANNPRINDGAVHDVVQSIKDCNNLDPIEIDENNVILSGHTRLMALQQLGYEETECIRYTGLTEEQKRKYRILAIKTNELAEWDNAILDLELEDLDFSEYEFDFDEVYDEGYGTDFSLPDGDKSVICQMTFTLHEKQKELIEYAMSIAKDTITETFGNENSNGNALYEVVRQWAELKK